ncbi:MAG: flagellum-specific ATP synthase FliI, partial [Polyangiaceae bacterium]
MSDVEPISLEAHVERVKSARGPLPEGLVHNVIGTLVEVAGVVAEVGAQLEVKTNGRPLTLEVLGFKGGNLLTAPLGSILGVAPGARVRLKPHAASVAVGDALLGRVIDAFGQPLDGGPVPMLEASVPLHAPPPAPFTR